MKLKIAFTAVAMMSLSALVHARTPTPSDLRGAEIDKRQANQAQRIDQGVKSGELNARETARL